MFHDTNRSGDWDSPTFLCIGSSALIMKSMPAPNPPWVRRSARWCVGRIRPNILTLCTAASAIPARRGRSLPASASDVDTHRDSMPRHSGRYARTFLSGTRMNRGGPDAALCSRFHPRFRDKRRCDIGESQPECTAETVGPLSPAHEAAGAPRRKPATATVCVDTEAGGDNGGPGKYEHVGNSRSVLIDDQSHDLHPHPYRQPRPGAQAQPSG
jgi:hypothetical protein